MHLTLPLPESSGKVSSVMLIARSTFMLLRRKSESHLKFARLAWIVSAAATYPGCVAPVSAQRLENQVATFAALDKVTARISKLEVKLNETVRFGSLKVTPRACYSRSATEQPKTTTFVEVDEVALDGKEKRLFTGWMFAESPGLHAVEHPVFDVWLTECAQPKGAVTQRPGGGAQQGSGSAGAGGQSPSDAYVPRRRPPR